VQILVSDFYSIAYLALASAMNSGGCTNRFLKKLAGFQDRVHDDGKLSCHSDGSPLEADLLFQPQPPVPKFAVGMGSGQNNHSGLVQQPTQMVVTAPRYVAVIVNFTRLIAPRGQAQLGSGLSRATPEFSLPRGRATLTLRTYGLTH